MNYLLSQFIMGSVRGVFSYGFCDFGDTFTVFDKTGEEPVEFFISKITKVNTLYYFHLSVFICVSYISRVIQLSFAAWRMSVMDWRMEILWN